MNENKSTGSAAANELVVRVRQGDSGAFEQLLSMYEPMISAAIRRYLPDGEDEDDARQEALAGFYRAALSFDINQPAVAFGLYAKICVSHALISHVRDIERRMRGTAHNLEYDDYVRYYGDAAADPAELVVERESTETLRRLIRESLSPFENKVWDMHVAGVPTQVIATRLDKPVRSIDNALYRIRKKLRTMLESGGYQ